MCLSFLFCFQAAFLSICGVETVPPDYLGWLAKALWLWWCVPSLGWGLVQLGAEMLAGQISEQGRQRKFMLRFTLRFWEMLAVEFPLHLVICSTLLKVHNRSLGWGDVHPYLN